MPQTEPSGWIVVVERGAVWPGTVFERLADREGVAMVTWLPDEPLLCFLTRLAHGCTLLERNGVRIRSAVMACCGERGADPAARAMVVRSIANRLARDRESCVTLVGDGADRTTPTDLIALADTLVTKGTAPVRIEVISQHALSRPTPAQSPRPYRVALPGGPAVAPVALSA